MEHTKREEQEEEEEEEQELEEQWGYGGYDDDDDNDEEEEERIEREEKGDDDDDELYDAQLDDGEQCEIDEIRKNKQSDALLSCPLCFTIICICCKSVAAMKGAPGQGARRKRQKDAEEWAAYASDVRNCKLEDESSSSSSSSGEDDEMSNPGPSKNNRHARSEERKGNVSASSNIVCRVCGTVVGRRYTDDADKGSHVTDQSYDFIFSGVLPSET